MAETRRLYPSAVIHCLAPAFAEGGDTLQIRWSGLVVDVTHERILVCNEQAITSGAAILPYPIRWPDVVWARFTVDGDPIVRPGE